MVFSSAVFLFAFLPVVFILYLITPGFKTKNGILIVASLLFYAYGEPSFVFVMLGSIIINYFLALGIAAYRKLAKSILALSILINLGLIGVFKYAGFALENINSIFGTNINMPGIALPIGISFFTFQIMSYVIDVYRNPDMVQKNLFKLALYISFFPQLVAGPIVKYHDIAEYLEYRKIDIVEIQSGIQRFIIGLSKKMLLANTMGYVADQMFNMGADNLSTNGAWIGAVCYTLQIFFDFSGYSDMAIGIGHMFGFTFKENFNHPYISTSIQEFWRRWHISLSTWFKEYLYIPLGGNRKGKFRTQINKFIVFFLTGLWHGASWNFVVWGLIHGFTLIIEDLFNRKEKLQRFKFIGFIYTMLIVIVAFVLFRADTFTEGLIFIKKMFMATSGSREVDAAVSMALSPSNIFFFTAAIFMIIPYSAIRAALFEKSLIISSVVSFALLIICILNIANASFNPFIYFRF